MVNQLIKLFTSLRLTVVCLALGIVLVFAGTLAQVDEGLYDAQNRWFRSFFVWWHPGRGAFGLPIFPGGYLIGSVLLINLIAAHIKRFQFTWKKLGIHLTHLGIILLLVGQLATDMLSEETHLRLVEGEAKNFSESHLNNELVFARDAATTGREEVIAISESLVAKGGEIRHPQLPVTIRVKQYWVNADFRPRGPVVDKDTPPPAEQGIGARVIVTGLPHTRKMDDRDFPAAVIELSGPNGSLGTWFVSTGLRDGEELKIGNATWRFRFRWERRYTPYTVHLLKTTHEEYTGTGIAKNFQSRVRLENPVTRENREVDIYMNNPLRYAGLTYYQHQMGRMDKQDGAPYSVLQVVRNPGWLTPYAGCGVVAGGMVVQFLIHLVGFLKRRIK